MKKLITYIAVCLSAIAVAQKPNVLFIAVDDLNCDINAYGNDEVSSPNLDALASDGTIFMNNHCQQAVCGASRTSLLTGWMPQKSGITSFYEYFRDMYPNMVTIPQHFKNNNYRVEGVGKIYDNRNVSEDEDNQHDEISWDEWHEISNSGRYVDSDGKPSTEAIDTTDAVYNDGKHAQIAIDRVAELAKSDEPFFFAVGFQKPHLPFVAPKKYWDMYDRASISLRTYKDIAQDDYEGFYNPGGELRGYDDIPEEGDIPEDKERELIHGYYACVSFIDAQIGELIATLKASGEYDNTIIVFWGDHGWHLGDHNMWTKHTNFEQATRSPLLIKGVNTAKNNVVTAPTGHIDIFPTLSEMAGLELLEDKDGKSLVPLLNNANADVNEFTVSRFTRSGYDGNALRDERYRFVDWTHSKGDKKYQLFDYQEDSLETKNLAYEAEYQDMIANYMLALNGYLDGLMDEVYNYDFELVVDGKPALWDINLQQDGDGIISSSTDAHEGMHSMKIENKTATRIQDVGAKSEVVFATNSEVKVSFYAKGTTGTKMRVNTQHQYENSDPRYTSSQVFELTDDYQKYECVIGEKESDSGEIPIGFYLRFQMGEVAGDYYIDDVVIVPDNPSGIDDVEKKASLKLYPNPCKDVLTVEDVSGNYTIYNQQGGAIIQGYLDKGQTQVDVSSLPNGVYFISFDIIKAPFMVLK